MENIFNDMDSSDLFGIRSPLSGTGFGPLSIEQQESLDSFMGLLENDDHAPNSEIQAIKDFLEKDLGLTESANVEINNTSDINNDQKILNCKTGIFESINTSPVVAQEFKPELVNNASNLWVNENLPILNNSDATLSMGTPLNHFNGTDQEFNDPDKAFMYVPPGENADLRNTLSIINYDENYSFGDTAEPLVINEITDLSQSIMCDQIDNNNNGYIMANVGQENNSLDESHMHNNINQSLTCFTDDKNVFFITDDGGQITNMVSNESVCNTDDTNQQLIFVRTDENGCYIISNCDNENTNMNSNESCNIDGPIELIDTQMAQNNCDNENTNMNSNESYNIDGPIELIHAPMAQNNSGNYISSVMINGIETIDHNELSLNILQESESQLLDHAPAEQLVINDINELNQSIMCDQIDNNNGYIMANVGQENNSLDESHMHNNIKQSIACVTEDGNVIFITEDGSEITSFDLSNIVSNESCNTDDTNQQLIFVRTDENGCYFISACDNENTNINSNESCNIDGPIELIDAPMAQNNSGNYISSVMINGIESQCLLPIFDQNDLSLNNLQIIESQLPDQIIGCRSVEKQNELEVVTMKPELALMQEHSVNEINFKSKTKSLKSLPRLNPNTEFLQNNDSKMETPKVQKRKYTKKAIKPSPSAVKEFKFAVPKIPKRRKLH